MKMTETKNDKAKSYETQPSTNPSTPLYYVDIVIHTITTHKIQSIIISSLMEDPINFSPYWPHDRAYYI